MRRGDRLRVTHTGGWPAIKDVMARQTAAVTQAYLDIFQSRSITQVADQAPPGEVGVDSELESAVFQDVTHGLWIFYPNAESGLTIGSGGIIVIYDAARRK